jgi:hypothetical protein
MTGMPDGYEYVDLVRLGAALASVATRAPLRRAFARMTTDGGIECVTSPVHERGAEPAGDVAPNT